MTVAMPVGVVPASVTLPALKRRTTKVGHLRYAIGTAPTFDYPTSAGRNAYVVLQAWELAERAALKAANPSVKCLVYKNLAHSIATSQNGLFSTGVSQPEANTHETWFQHKTAVRQTNQFYSYLWIMNPGDAGYRQRWADNVSAEVTANGWDGVFADDVNPVLAGTTYPTDEYSGDTPYQAATLGMLQAVGPQIPGLFAGNFGRWGEFDYTPIMNGWLPYVDAAMDEQFVKFAVAGVPTTGQGYVDEGRWDREVAALRLAHDYGVAYLAVTQSPATDTAAARYGYASALMGAYGGQVGYQLSGADYVSEPAWIPEYAYDLGTPVEEMQGTTGQIRTRRFTKGLVVVNPTAGSLTATFGGTYSGSGLTSQTGATLAANTALVLTAG